MRELTGDWYVAVAVGVYDRCYMTDAILSILGIFLFIEKISVHHKRFSVSPLQNCFEEEYKEMLHSHYK